MYTLLLLSACAPQEGTEKDSSVDVHADDLDPATVAAIAAAADGAIGVDSGYGYGFATGCSVAVWRDGAVVYAAGFGTRNEAGEPVTVDTEFVIGSDTKKMTALSLLRQVDAGAISLDTLVGDLLPSLHFADTAIHIDMLTVRQMLSHQSGLFDYTRYTPTPADDQLAAITYGRFAENEYAMMPAGIAWSYSNPNYSLAGLLDEELEGGFWPDLVIDNVARPLGMNHTWARRDDMLAAEADAASGYGLVPDGPLDTFDPLDPGPDFTVGWTTPEDYTDDAFTRPAGLVWSTASDMARLQVFLDQGDPSVVSDASLTELRAGQVALYPNLDPDEYGYGFGLERIRGFIDADGAFRDVIFHNHGGSTFEMTSTFTFLPDQHVGVSVLCNGAADTSTIVSEALTGAASERLPAATEPPIIFQDPKSDFSEYAGTFYDEVLGDVDLSVHDGDLRIAVPFLDEIGVTYDAVLTPYALDLFLFVMDGPMNGDVAPFDLSFYPSVEGTPASYAVNRAFVFQRVTSEARRERHATSESRIAFERWWTATQRAGRTPFFTPPHARVAEGGWRPG